MNKKNKDNPFAHLTFDDFRMMAANPSLSRHEKVGFPDTYREGKEEAIFRDVQRKLASLNDKERIVLEIGPGCSRLPVMLAELCRDRGSKLIFVDSAEMLMHLPNDPHIQKYAGRYPNIPDLAHEYPGRINTILAYSVVQYVFAEGNLWDFLDCSLALLSDHGEMLLADIPNVTMRKRFFASENGRRYHSEYTGNNEPPEVHFNRLEPGQMDDSVVLGLLSRVRAQGFHAWVVPQAHDLPMSNRREDILIRKP